MKVLELTRSRLAFDIIAGALLAVLCVNSVFAQTYGKGRHIEPAFEGWRPNDDGTFNMMFGYMNENWEETPNMPVGENNNFSPGDMDRGSLLIFCRAAIALLSKLLFLLIGEIENWFGLSTSMGWNAKLMPR